MKKAFFKWFAKRSLSEMIDIIGHCRDMYHDKFHQTFRKVEVFNNKGNISSIIEKETGFECYHEPSQNQNCIGTNVILVPVAQYTPELGSALEAKWDTFR